MKALVSNPPPASYLLLGAKGLLSERHRLVNCFQYLQVATARVAIFEEGTNHKVFQADKYDSQRKGAILRNSVPLFQFQSYHGLML